MYIKTKNRFQACRIPAKVYDRKIRIYKVKHKDLLSLCETGLVPLTYHEFYKSLILRSNQIIVLN